MTREEFEQHLENVVKIVDSWPDWKKNILGVQPEVPVENDLIELSYRKPRRKKKTKRQ